MNTQQSRNGFRWSVNEVLALQREFELLGWSIDEIAQKHNRTPNAIMHKLDQEGFAEYNELYSNYHHITNSSSVEDNEELLIGHDGGVVLSQRVDGLEESVSEIKNMITQMMQMFTSKNSSKSNTSSKISSIF